MLPEDVERFIRKHVRSVWALEILLLIYRNRERSWTAHELNRELRSSPQLVVDVLLKFERSELITRAAGERYQWNDATPELKRLVAHLAEAYATYPFSVIEAIYSTQVEQIQALADAFKIKKE